VLGQRWQWATIFKEKNILRGLENKMSLSFWCFQGEKQVIHGVFFGERLLVSFLKEMVVMFVFFDLDKRLNLTTCRALDM
jgi:hypothetical protein